MSALSLRTTGWLLLISATLLISGLATSVDRAPTTPAAIATPQGTSATPGSETHGASSSGASTAPSTSGLAHARQVENALRAKGISPDRVHLPNFGAEVADHDRTIAPGSSQAPAPMGVADIGLRNVSGKLKPYLLDTTSAEGTVNITDLQSLYVDGDGPNTFGIQMNSVVSGVTIFGQTGYQFWSQNYVDYTPSTEQLVFGDEVWNFSSTSGLFPTSSVYSFSPNGTFADFPELYQGYGPSITVGYPFSLSLYLNTSVISDRPALFFNYTVSSPTFTRSASFDYLIFNSSVGTPTAPAPVPYYQADGFQYDAIGLINDMEIDLLGNDGGDVTAFTAANATMSLQYYNATSGRMEEVPSAFNAGQETGETSVGLAVFPSGTGHPCAMVRTGPGFLTGLWNYSGASTDVSVTLHLTPAAAFVFVNPGAGADPEESQWIPTALNATTTFYLPPGGTYTMQALMSDFSPETQTLFATSSQSLYLHLAPDPALGIYTPLFAFDNAELANLSISGSGTAHDPYVLESNQLQSLDPEFAQWDDYLFPVFPGLLLANTSAWVTVVPASFSIDLPSWLNAGSFGLPSTNNLQLQLYDASNISIVRGAAISGWLSSFLAFFPDGSLMLWNTTGVLVASNTFAVQGVGVTMYGGTGNTLWGNTFYSAPSAAPDPTAILGGSSPTGISESESGDLVYNNYFSLPVPAATLTYDPFYCGQFGICDLVLYQDWWNVSQQPATNVHMVNGMALTGSIIGTTYQGGNYWSNYGEQGNPYGVLPYNDSGQIAIGGDYHPLVPFTLYTVMFMATGPALPPVWNVTTEGVVWSSTSTTLQIESPNGTFSLQITAPANFLVAAPYEFNVSGSAITVNVGFTPIVGVTFSETGLAAGALWAVTLAGTGTGGALEEVNSTSTTAAFSVPAGSYQFTARAVGYAATPSKGSVSATPTGGAQAIVFSLILGTLTVQVTPKAASLLVAGAAAALTDGRVWQNLTPGVYALEANLAGYYPYFNNATVSGGATTSLVVVLDPVTPPVGADGTLTLTVQPTTSSVMVNGAAVSLTGGSFSGAYAPGTYSIMVSDPGYLPYFNNVSVASGHTTTLLVSMTAVPTIPAPSSSTTPSGISTEAWGAIGGLAALAVVLLVLLLWSTRRERRPPKAAENARPVPEKPEEAPTASSPEIVLDRGASPETPAPEPSSPPE